MVAGMTQPPDYGFRVADHEQRGLVVRQHKLIGAAIEIRYKRCVPSIRISPLEPVR